MTFGITDKVPKFYGSVTVGERGQVVIPAEARHELDIKPSTKLLVFGGANAKGIGMVKVELMSEFLKAFGTAIQNLEQTLREASQEETEC